MKPRLAAVLSIAGVLSAGSAAALVNTQVLQSDSADANPAVATTTFSPSTLAAVDPAATSVPSPTTSTSLVDDTRVTAANSVTVPSATSSVPSSLTVESPSTTAVTTPPLASDASRSTGVYQLGDGGTVTLSTAGGVLTIVAVEPAPGWVVHEAENEDAHNIEVRLRTDDREVRFEANLLFGVVNTNLRTDDD